MSWMKLVGHDVVVERFRRTIRAGRLSSTFLLVGPSGVGKFRFAQQVAQSLFCERHAEAELMACQTCPSCQQVISETHPDLIVVRRPADRTAIPLELLIGTREHRLREGFISQVAMRPMIAARKVAILDDADDLNDEGANSLLKTLEEPPVGSVIMLVGSSEQRQLPTIRSRSQIIRFQPLGMEDLRALFRQRQVELSDDRLAEIARLSFGSFADALLLADDSLDEMRCQLWQELSAGDERWRDLTQQITAFIESAGKEAQQRRPHLLRVMQWVTLFYRQTLRASAGLDAMRSPETDRPIDVQLVAERIERCSEALDQIEANANVATLAECWLDDLYQAAAGRGRSNRTTS